MPATSKGPVFRHGACLYLILVITAGCGSTRPAGQPPASGFSFALIGDMPYLPADDARFDRLIADINADASLAWVIHAGDIKAGDASCSDAYLEGRLEVLQRFEPPLVYTPGDNEWTDCHREPAGGYLPLERLARLRSLFFADTGRTLGRHPMRVVSQAEDPEYAEFSEHVCWIHDGIVFATFHVVGSQNAMAPFATRTVADDEESARRTEAAIDWLRETFREASRSNSPGVFLTIHANPFIDARPNSPFRPFLRALEEEVVRFGRPVVLAHGDTHYFRIDKPMMSSTSGRRVLPFTRVETFGARDVHWLRVTVDPADPQVFSFRQELREE